MTTNGTNATETTTAKARKAKKAKGPTYPFASKREILGSQASFDVCLEHLGILVGRQTTDEVETLSTKHKNRRGLMSSHAVNGTKLHAKVANGEELLDEDVAKIREIVSHYGKQLAAFYREEMIAGDPELAEVARIFSAA